LAVAFSSHILGAAVVRPAVGDQPGISVRQARAFPAPGETPSYIIDFGIVLGALGAAGAERPGQSAASAAQAWPKDALRTELVAPRWKTCGLNLNHGPGAAGASG